MRCAFLGHPALTQRRVIEGCRRYFFFLCAGGGDYGESIWELETSELLIGSSIMLTAKF